MYNAHFICKYHLTSHSSGRLHILKENNAYNVEFNQGSERAPKIAIYFGFGVILLALYAFVQRCGTCVVGHWRPCRAAAMMFVAVAHLRMSKYMTLGLSRETDGHEHQTTANTRCLTSRKQQTAKLTCSVRSRRTFPWSFWDTARVEGLRTARLRNQTMSHQYTHQLCSLAEETLILHYQLKQNMRN